MDLSSTNRIQEKNKIDYIDQLSNEIAKNLSVPGKHLTMGVIIPAKNESETILETLTSLKIQEDHNSVLIDKEFYEVLILCHNCNDNTFEICTKFSKENSDINLHILELNSEVANTVGAARRVLMNIASSRLNRNGLIISTDADTIPDKKWLFNLSHYINQDISLICGLINVNLQNLAPQTQKYLAAKDEYLLLKARFESEILPNEFDPWPRHSYNWGPNLAIRNQVYKAVGGINPLHFLEDVDLYNRVVSSGFKIRHCINSKVKTSTRIDSRCTEGFGAELRVWTDFEGVAYNVEGLDKLKSRYKIYNQIKDYFNNPSEVLLKNLCETAFIDKSQLLKMFHESSIPDSMIIKMEKYLNNCETWKTHFPNIGVVEACRELNEYFENKEKH
ncbi:glycosyltransferase [Aequorivita capsosiphonis]|uniref:glycosyltransferase n=1 Tax=Aequorivita capsosiphonis TaxID=487317 RepID=UPI0003FFC0A9|nr:glycosyltransferase family 2 protein [Aequorivita capsosiphonis]